MSVPTSSPRQLADLCNNGQIDLMDVRTPVEYREVHVAVTNTCGTGLLLARMPWNQVKETPAKCCATQEVCP